eukprot:9039311-Pyramimonas_sp.AAC.1
MACMLTVCRENGDEREGSVERGWSERGGQPVLRRHAARQNLVHHPPLCADVRGAPHQAEQYALALAGTHRHPAGVVGGMKAAVVEHEERLHKVVVRQQRRLGRHRLTHQVSTAGGHQKGGRQVSSHIRVDQEGTLPVLVYTSEVSSYDKFTQLHYAAPVAPEPRKSGERRGHRV